MELHTWALVQVFVFFSMVQYAIIGTRVDFFQPQGQWGISFAWPGMPFLAIRFFLGAIFLIIPDN